MNTFLRGKKIVACLVITATFLNSSLVLSVPSSAKNATDVYRRAKDNFNRRAQEATEDLANTLMVLPKIVMAAAGLIGLAQCIEKLPLAPANKITEEAYKLLFLSIPGTFIMKYVLAEFEKKHAQKALAVKPIEPHYTLKHFKGRLPEEILLLIDQIRKPEHYRNNKNRQGLLLHGKHGTGKTLLAHVIAHELHAPLFIITADTILHGGPKQAAENIGIIFKIATKTAQNHSSETAVVCFDEIDAIAPQRGSDEPNPVISALLSYLTAAPKNNLVVIATSNFPERLDNAIKSPARLMPVEIGLPTTTDRALIIAHYLTAVHYPSTLIKETAHALAEKCAGKSPADLKYIIEYAHNRATYHNKKMDTEILYESLDRWNKHLQVNTHKA